MKNRPRMKRLSMKLALAALLAALWCTFSGCPPPVEQQKQVGEGGEKPLVEEITPEEQLPVLKLENVEWKEEKLSYRFHFPEGMPNETLEAAFYLTTRETPDGVFPAIFTVSPGNAGQTWILMHPGTLRPYFYEKGVDTPDGLLLFQSRYLNTTWEGQMFVNLLSQGEVGGRNVEGLFESEQMPITLRYISFDGFKGFRAAVNYSGVDGQVRNVVGVYAGVEDLAVEGKMYSTHHIKMGPMNDFWYSVDEPRQLIRWTLTLDEQDSISMDFVSNAPFSEEDHAYLEEMKKGFDPEEVEKQIEQWKEAKGED